MRRRATLTRLLATLLLLVNIILSLMIATRSVSAVDDFDHEHGGRDNGGGPCVDRGSHLEKLLYLLYESKSIVSPIPRLLSRSEQLSPIVLSSLEQIFSV